MDAYFNEFSDVEEFKELYKVFQNGFGQAIRNQDPPLWSFLNWNLADEAYRFACETLDPSLMQDAIDTRERTLYELDKDNQAWEYALAKCDIGRASIYLAQWTNEPSYFEQALDNYREAAKVSGDLNRPDFDAHVQCYLAIAINEVALSSHDVGRLVEAVAALRKVLNSKAVELAGESRDVFKSELAIALGCLGLHTSDIQILLEADVALQDALSIAPDMELVKDLLKDIEVAIERRAGEIA